MAAIKTNVADLSPFLGEQLPSSFIHVHVIDCPVVYQDGEPLGG